MAQSFQRLAAAVWLAAKSQLGHILGGLLMAGGALAVRISKPLSKAAQFLPPIPSVSISGE